jgi:hypothetical protein
MLAALGRGMAARASTIAFATLLGGCAVPRLAGALPEPWSKIRGDAQSVAYHHASGGTIAADITCGDADDVPLDVLTNHLLFGIRDRRELRRTGLIVDGRAALRTRLDGTIDGVRVTLDVVVLKKDGCTYDLLLLASPEVASRREPDFERFIAAFHRRTAP